MEKTAIIFGGSGFVGKHLTESLVADGRRVVVADIVNPGSLPDGATFEYCDVTEPIMIAHQRAFDEVYHLAAVHRTPGHEPHEYYQTNVAGAVNLVDWMESGGEKLLVFTSSISVYGPSEELKSETSPPQPASDYGRSKLMAEMVFRSWRGRSAERRLVIARPAVVFGSGEGGNFTRLAHALRHRIFLYPGRRTTIKSCGNVTDLVRALRFGADRTDPEILFNYCYPDRPTIEEICNAFYTVAGYKLPRTIPPSLVGGLTKTLETVNPGDKGSINAARIVKLTTSTNIAADALQEMGFEWETDLESALRAWHRESSSFV